MTRSKPAVIHFFIPLFLAGVAGGVTQGMASMQLIRLNMPPAAAAWTSVAYFLAQFLLSPTTGKLSDCIGRRPVMALSLATTLLGYLLLAFVPSQFWVLIVFMATSAIASVAQISASQASIADVSDAEDRTARLGIIMAAYPLGAAFAQYLMGQWQDSLTDFLYKSNSRNAWLVASGVTVASLLYVALVLPESLVAANRKPWRWVGSDPFSAAIRLKRWPLVAGLSAFLFVATLASAVMATLWSEHFHTCLHWNTQSIGMGIILAEWTSLAALLILLPRIVNSLGERKCIYLGLLVTVITMVVFGMSSNSTTLWTFIAISGCGRIAMPATLSLITTGAPKDEQGTVQGTLESLFALASFLGSLLWAWIASRNVTFNHGVTGSGLAFVGAAVLTLVCIAMAWRIFKKETSAA
jgi:DHA1 family tetracycline resistance protein-like MFS transporter